MRKIFLSVSIAAAGLLLLSFPVIAHHGAAALDTGKEITLKGSVTEWIWSNPHCFLKFDAKDDTGRVRNWAVETQNPTTMTLRGFSRTAFKVGAEVTVTVEPVKNGEPVGRMLSVILPDGQKLIAAAPTTPASTPPPPQPIR
ncbi:MAG: hypothetical protein DMF92_10085 [Acidobacteria bacterium]|nr:MAG: hypothetical protein DMF92_10085 [Acidobacteriota bacterium]